MGAKPGENNMNSQLQHLLRNNPHIWLGNEAQPKGEGVTGLPTGYPSLDAILPERGWPKNALIEMVTPQWGFGELQLLLPLMRSVTQQKRWMLWVCPPYIPYGPALASAGVDINYLVTIDSKTTCKDAMWSVEKALQSESCGLVMAWLDSLPNGVIRRLQLAASEGKTSGVLFRNHETTNSPAALQLRLKHTGQGMHAHVKKSRGANRYRSATINLPFH